MGRGPATTEASLSPGRLSWAALQSGQERGQWAWAFHLLSGLPRRGLALGAVAVRGQSISWRRTQLRMVSHRYLVALKGPSQWHIMAPPEAWVTFSTEAPMAWPGQLCPAETGSAAVMAKQSGYLRRLHRGTVGRKALG